MKSTPLRLLSGSAGLCAALVAIVGPVLFIANERQEAKSSHQYNGHASFWGAVVGSATVLLLVLFLGSSHTFFCSSVSRVQNQVGSLRRAQHQDRQDSNGEYQRQRSQPGWGVESDAKSVRPQ